MPALEIYSATPDFEFRRVIEIVVVRDHNSIKSKAPGKVHSTKK
jgi:hypothetical protein